MFEVLLYFKLPRRYKRRIKRSIADLETIAADLARYEGIENYLLYILRNTPAPDICEFSPVAPSEDVNRLWRRVISDNDLFVAYSNILARSEDTNKQLIYLGYYLARTEGANPQDNNNKSEV